MLSLPTVETRMPLFEVPLTIFATFLADEKLHSFFYLFAVLNSGLLFCLFLVLTMPWSQQLLGSCFLR